MVFLLTLCQHLLTFCRILYRAVKVFKRERVTFSLSLDSNEGSEMPEIQVNDEVTLHYEEKGDGFPLLLVHGLLSDLTSWRYQVDPLAPHYRVITIDLKGFGKSTKPRKEYQVHSHAEDLKAFLQHLKITQAHVCGLSMGGMVAEVLAIKYPQLVKGLILADSAAMIADYAVSDRLTLLADHDMNWFANWGTKKILRLASDEAKNHVREMIRRVDKTDYRLAIISTAGFNIANELKNIKSPTLIIQGEKDETVPMWHAEQLKSWIPNAKFVIMKGASHMTPVESPEEFNQLVLNFLAEVDSTT
jgi:3-oxoadipate enol-lactonase